jgi:hypothetical protein
LGGDADLSGSGMGSGIDAGLPIFEELPIEER